jgi:hypothetical protein
MNNKKRDRIEQALQLSERLRKAINLLDGFEESYVRKNLDICIASCESICSILKIVISEEVSSHENVPINLHSADNTFNMRYAVRRLNDALTDYTSLLTGLKSFVDKCGETYWSERADATIDFEVTAEFNEKSLKRAL